METFVDGDMAANNGGWQWTASVSRRGFWVGTRLTWFRLAQTLSLTL
jgi:deoxyribodipyrimidine photolyase